MKNLNVHYENCVRMCKSMNIPVEHVDNVQTTNQKHNFGVTTHNYNTNTVTISINECLLDDSVPDKILDNTILHELLHTCKGCQNHGKLWKTYARLLNDKYGYTIQRCATQQEMEYIKNVRPPFKYILKCEKCGYEYGQYRKSKAIDHPENYKCGCKGCGGALIRVK